MTRAGGALRLSLIVPHGAVPPPETLYPETLVVAQDGPVPLPPYGAPPE